MIAKADVLAEAIAALASGNVESASEIIRSGYPFEARRETKRSWTPSLALEIFIRDGFIDRYSGTKLVYPGALQCLSMLLPQVFPADPNWKMSETHFAYWELFPTLDHIQPGKKKGVGSLFLG